MSQDKAQIVEISRIIRLQPARLLVSGVGQFSEPFSVNFIDTSGSPSNIFLLASPNGLGKTTLLVTLSSVFECFYEFDGTFLQEDLNSGRGFAQLDAILDLEIGDKLSTIGISICCGRRVNAFSWDPIGLDNDITDGIESFSTIRFSQGSSSASSDDIGRAFLRHIEAGIGTSPSRLFDDEHQLPTMLSFPATRRVVRPPEQGMSIVRPPDFGFKPLQVFDYDGVDWQASLSNVLLWLYWLDDGRYEELQDLVEKSVLTDRKRSKILGPVNRPTLMPLIHNSAGNPHRLDRLSHGERSIFQILARIAMHMTGNTIVLIDELELHLHPNWSLGLLETLKRIVSTRSVSVIFTTHSPEIIREYAHDRVEEGLRKGGHIIEYEELGDG